MTSCPPENAKNMIKELGADKLIETLKKMLLIRNFETRAEAAYLAGKIGGFFHAYLGQEAIQTAILDVFGPNHWFVGFYRCHALALLLGASPQEIMAEFYGRATGNAKGRGGSMHLYTERMLGGFAIVGGQVPIAIGAAFSLKYQRKKDELAICFLGEGAVAQGAFHEALNMAALWDLPCIIVIENNHWGMGTHVSRAVSVKNIAEKQAASYGIKGVTLDGMDYFALHQGFSEIYKEALQTSRPVLVECVCERFRGHSISDPGVYRSKQALEECKRKDPIHILRYALEDADLLTEPQFKKLNQEQKQRVLEAMEYAENAPWPSPTTLEEDVYAT